MNHSPTEKKLHFCLVLACMFPPLLPGVFVAVVKVWLYSRALFFMTDNHAAR